MRDHTPGPAVAAAGDVQRSKEPPRPHHKQDEPRTPEETRLSHSMDAIPRPPNDEKADDKRMEKRKTKT